MPLLRRSSYLIVLLLASLLVSTCLENSSPPNVELAVSPINATIGLGDTIRMSATISDAGRVVPVAINWKSSAPGIASIDASGLVTGISLGAVRIRAETQRLSAEVTIAVLPPLRLLLNRNIARLLL